MKLHRALNGWLFCVVACWSVPCTAQQSEFVPLNPDRPCQMAFKNEGHFVNDEGVRESSGGTTIVRFLRTVDVEQEDHCWLESDYEIETNGFSYGSTHRLLIPESALRFGKAPLQNVARGLFFHTQMTRREAIEIDVSGDWANRPWFTRALIHFDFQPEFEPLPAESIKTPAGEFQCDVWRVVGRRQEEDDQREIEHIFYLSAETPAPLVAWSTRTVEADSPGSFEFNFRLSEYDEEPVAIIPLDDD